MSLAPGTRLGPYEIEASLGAGGMGEVYRARDVRLERTVAVKVLPEHRTSSEKARQRLRQEARAISRLSHPNVCAIFDVGESDHDPRISYLVMEYLEGETFADRLARGPLPLEMVRRHGMEIAAALDLAHRSGLVHRDLKPGNIMLTGSGAKVLDFGLARLLRSPAPVGAGSALTTASELTQEGAILGTLGYMSPEQLEGKPADARSDIFALGAVLYEMATGRRAFHGTSQATVISAILSQEPPTPSSVVRSLPKSFDRLVRVCLAKDPGGRWQSARDVQLLLEELDESPVAAPSRRRPAVLPWLLAAAATTAALWAGLGRQPTTSAPVRFDVPPPAGYVFRQRIEARYFALSPDGTNLAFVALPKGAAPPDRLYSGSDTSRVFVRPLAAAEARPLPGSEGATSLFWSPDSRWLAFFAGGKLKRVAMHGGDAALPICDIRPGAGYAGSWGADGRIVFASIDGDAIESTSTAANGARPEIAVKADQAKGETRLVWPSFLPDGRGFLYLSHRDDGTRDLMLGAAGKPPRRIGPFASDVQMLSSGALLYVREGTLMAQRFDPRSAGLSGEPTPIAAGVDYQYSSGSSAFSASSAGSLAFHAGEDRGRILAIGRSGRIEQVLGEEGRYLDVALSPDGRRLLFDRAAPSFGTLDVWVHDRDRGGETRITAEPRSDVAGVWLPDRRSIAYSASLGGGPRLRRRDLSSGLDEPLLPQRGFQLAQDVSPDGKVLAYVERYMGSSGHFEAWTLELEGARRALPLYASTFTQSRVRFSPDGRYVAFVSDETGRREVYIAPYPPPGPKVRVSSEGATLLRWARASGELLYVTDDRRLVATQVKTTPALEIGKPATVFTLPEGRPWSEFDVTADGQTFVAVVNDVAGGELPISVLTGWTPPVR